MRRRLHAYDGNVRTSFTATATTKESSEGRGRKKDPPGWLRVSTYETDLAQVTIAFAVSQSGTSGAPPGP